MTRYESHQKKRLTVTIVLILIILIVLVGFIFTNGIKLVINTSVYVSGLFSNKEAVTPAPKNTGNLISTLEIDNIPTATNAATITISGSVYNLDSVDIYLNNADVKTVQTAGLDNWSAQIDNLQKGDNQIYAKGINKNQKQNKITTNYDVLYKPDKPKLDISSPPDNAKTSKSDVMVNGSTDKETYIKINGNPVVVDANGTFQLDVKLNTGDNKIDITATDIAGNFSEKIITVTYQSE